jgi:arginyl-tRNA--protein-N-Asp/Glu arginylyltransferase
MKLVFSEHVSDYAHYTYPYAVWAFREDGERPSQLYAAGFLPAARSLDRFYLCRQIRVDLTRFQPSSENRRVLRKGEGLRMDLVPRADFGYSAERRTFCKTYADAKWGPDKMSFERLDGVFASPVITHLLVFTDLASGREVGLATLYCEPPVLAHYYYGFYDLHHLGPNLGMCMMTLAVKRFAEDGFGHLYLGTCYSKNALYKTQFSGAQFFNGFRWSEDLKELKFLLERDVPGAKSHLLENEEYVSVFHGGSLEGVATGGGFQVRL